MIARRRDAIERNCEGAGMRKKNGPRDKRGTPFDRFPKRHRLDTAPAGQLFSADQGLIPSKHAA